MRIQATNDQIQEALAELLEAQEAARRSFIDKDVKPAVAMAQAIATVQAFLEAVTPIDTRFPVLGAAAMAMADRARGIDEPYLRPSAVGSRKRKSTTSLRFWAEISTLISCLCDEDRPQVLGPIPLKFACKWVAVAMDTHGFLNPHGEPFHSEEVKSRHIEMKRRSARTKDAAGASGLLDNFVRGAARRGGKKHVEKIVAQRIDEAGGDEEWLEERMLTQKVIISLRYIYHPIIH